ncbi:MAG: hypothetical protein MZU97_19795 [Bacillus subtilis]|nr:hypothetical protein [Bacillus subtilis]
MTIDIVRRRASQALATGKTAVTAPLKETLASAMIQAELGYWSKDRVLFRRLLRVGHDSDRSRDDRSQHRPGTRQ